MANSRLVDPSDPTGNFKDTLRTIRTVTPTGTSADAANIQAALTAMAAVGGRVILKAGTYSVTTDVTGASNVVVEFMPGAVLDIASTKTVSLAGRIEGTPSASGAGTLTVVNSPSARRLTVLVTGDSRATGSSTAPGGSRIELGKRARLAGMPIEFVGPVEAPAVWSATDLRPEPQEPFCAGYPGETLTQVTTRWSAAGSVYTWIAARGAPDVVIVECGTNDANAGASATTMWTRMQSLLAAIVAICPRAKIVVESIPLFYTGASPSPDIATANGVIAAFNALLAAGVPALGAQYSYLDACAGFSRADLHTDGTHDLPHAAAERGRKLFSHLVGLFPGAVLSSQIVPRAMRPRAAQASAKFATPTTDQILGTADNTLRLPAGNFLGGVRLTVSALPAAFVYIAMATPSGFGYTKGWAVAIDGSVSPKTINYYDQGTGAGAVVAKQAPIKVHEPFWLFWHGDRTNGVVSLWVAVPENSTPGAPYILYCLGEATSVAAWAQSDASPILTLGKNAAGNGFTGTIDSFFYATGADVPARSSIRATLESIVFDGGVAPGIAAQWKINEGTGTSIASSVGGSAGTLTGAWVAAGVIPWPSDDKTGGDGLRAGFIGLGGGTQWGSTGLVRFPKPSEQGTLLGHRKNDDSGDLSLLSVDTANTVTLGASGNGGVYVKGVGGGFLMDTFYFRQLDATIRQTWTIAAASICNSASGTSLDFQTNGTSRIKMDGTGLGFFAATPAAKPTVTGSRGANAALASLLTALATLGLVTDSSS